MEGNLAMPAEKTEGLVVARNGNDEWLEGGGSGGAQSWRRSGDALGDRAWDEDLTKRDYGEGWGKKRLAAGIKR
ncbi:hypothetical protein E2562_001226 [Oryza meyeriana var. granulata]|uniref:Uncharacterized protein n=1 Tax=Oryza meyeriana var. granulata TaxID=110450 RepID=A0A6G1DB32_9ORYZ|nr:hypothetical protein E2562_001226 [Oryza meyeriana var. granulata]